MKKNLLTYKGLYGDNTFVTSISDFIHFEVLSARSKMYGWEIEEHLHTELVQLFIIRSGNSSLMSGNSKMELNAPCVVFVPTNTLHGFNFEPDTDGEVLSISESFFDTVLKNSPQIFLKINKLQQYYFDKNEEWDDFLYLKQKIEKETHEVVREKYVIIALFYLLFALLYRVHIQEEHKFTLSQNRSLVYYQDFLKLIKYSIQEALQVSEYALKMNITVVHLNRICQGITQKSALQVIHEMVMNEAKNYLLSTNYSISEIAYFFNFKDPAHFTKLFKKVVGASPGEFRKG